MSFFQLSPTFAILAYTDSLFNSQLNCDAIVVSVDLDQKYDQINGLATQVLAVYGTGIKQKFNSKIKKEYKKNDKLKAECIVVETGLQKPKFIFNSLIPFDCYSEKNPQDYKNFMTILFNNILEKAVETKITSLALPLLATGIIGGPVDLTISILIDVILNFNKKDNLENFKEIHLVNNEKAKTSKIVEKLNSILKKPDNNISKNSEINDQVLIENSTKINKSNTVKVCDSCKQRIKTVAQLKCDHTFCLGCLIEIKDNGDKCLSLSCLSADTIIQSSLKTIDDSKEKEIEIEKSCGVCLEKFDKFKILDKCKHELCDECYTRVFEIKPQCPFCQVYYGIPKGTQPPNGKMKHEIKRFSLKGFENFDTIVIHYSIPSGVQKKHHPSPGKSYYGIDRTAYLPASPDGYKALDLLKKAFDNCLIFTIGTSRTTNTEGLTWNDIHHKTEFSGTFGYPDATYLERLIDELKAHGIE
ncbi:unnamed protein product [Brachionus calyciflorus]|uniref:E3 ubiquitin-protein ligase n=1 Tax=Brachionus calyciflorus TaxID=104777 RepID=A0A814ELD5_9BILA|nr:unnamed protein product [Brachionus calyciflorus]